MFCCMNILPAPLQMCVAMCLRQDVTEEGKKAKLQSSKIEQDLSEQARYEMNVVKILILGAAESGKSTLIKQIKIIHSHGFSKQELLSFKPAVLDNLLTSMKFVLLGMGMLRINLANKKNKIHARSILSCDECLDADKELRPFVAHAFCALWADQGVRAAAARGYQFELNDSALYFFENMSRIIAPNYSPTEQDVLRVRVRTCGIIETQFQVDDIVFRLYDVGGQRSVHRKWLRCFDGIQAVLFIVALSSYDATLPEDLTVSLLQESCEHFASISSSSIFKHTSMILFMNKTDLFQEKILNSGRHLRLYDSTFKGPDTDVDAAAGHITAMFSARGGGHRPVFHHFTTATDTANIRVVFQVAVQQIIKHNLAAAQLL
ncbi:guanine nucleotide-binding protein G(o) subunit alpha-like [Corythoichthys intestinalis]|uniref:guanine nucleotide-binding protein G(o) subunit alpha-like n=1 Tax=Corythoichthys intestinalis TaxID=161448 RepID=UPI0025A66758|nr:guanine nucleotide-binding protein G(o) subunit alpha-like [Corythoichthys intestinalis]XP_061805985.1 guanine nucleotide-binding protein G(o) subunit alpha-like [Nerophis lumbriciformis]